MSLDGSLASRTYVSHQEHLRVSEVLVDIQIVAVKIVNLVLS